MSTSDTSKSSPQNLQARSASSGSASAEHPLPQPLKPPKRIARTILAALKGGVVPRIGLGWIAVGRRLEIEALLNDMEVVRDGGASFRFIVGRYGAGKSFLLQTLRTYVMERAALWWRMRTFHPNGVWPARKDKGSPLIVNWCRTSQRKPCPKAERSD